MAKAVIVKKKTIQSDHSFSKTESTQKNCIGAQTNHAQIKSMLNKQVV